MACIRGFPTGQCNILCSFLYAVGVHADTCVKVLKRNQMYNTYSELNLARAGEIHPHGQFEK